MKLRFPSFILLFIIALLIGCDPATPKKEEDSSKKPPDSSTNEFRPKLNGKTINDHRLIQNNYSDLSLTEDGQHIYYIENGIFHTINTSNQAHKALPALGSNCDNLYDGKVVCLNFYPIIYDLDDNTQTDLTSFNTPTYTSLSYHGISADQDHLILTATHSVSGVNELYILKISDQSIIRLTDFTSTPTHTVSVSVVKGNYVGYVVNHTSIPAWRTYISTMTGVVSHLTSGLTNGGSSLVDIDMTDNYAFFRHKPSGISKQSFYRSSLTGTGRIMVEDSVAYNRNLSKWKILESLNMYMYEGEFGAGDHEAYTANYDGSGDIRLDTCTGSGEKLPHSNGFQMFTEQWFIYEGDCDTDGTFELYASKYDGSVKIKVSGPSGNNAPDFFQVKVSPDEQYVFFYADTSADNDFKLYASELSDAPGAVKAAELLPSGFDSTSSCYSNPCKYEIIGNTTIVGIAKKDGKNYYYKAARDGSSSAQWLVDEFTNYYSGQMFLVDDDFYFAADLSAATGTHLGKISWTATQPNFTHIDKVTVSKIPSLDLYYVSDNKPSYLYSTPSGCSFYRDLGAGFTSFLAWDNVCNKFGYHPSFGIYNFYGDLEESGKPAMYASQAGSPNRMGDLPLSTTPSFRINSQKAYYAKDEDTDNVDEVWRIGSEESTSTQLYEGDFSFFTVDPKDTKIVFVEKNSSNLNELVIYDIGSTSRSVVKTYLAGENLTVNTYLWSPSGKTIILHYLSSLTGKYYLIGVNFESNEVVDLLPASGVTSPVTSIAYISENEYISYVSSHLGSTQHLYIQNVYTSSMKLVDLEISDSDFNHMPSHQVTSGDSLFFATYNSSLEKTQFFVEKPVIGESATLLQFSGEILGVALVNNSHMIFRGRAPGSSSSRLYHYKIGDSDLNTHSITEIDLSSVVTGSYDVSDLKIDNSDLNATYIKGLLFNYTTQKEIIIWQKLEL